MPSLTYKQAASFMELASVMRAFAVEADCPPGEEDSHLVVTPDGEMAVLRHGRLEEAIGSLTPTPDDFWRQPLSAPRIR